MRALRTFVFRRRTAQENWILKGTKPAEIQHMHSSAPWLCRDGIGKYMIIPNKARALHVTIHKEKPKAGAWFAIKMPGEGWALRVLTDLNINTNTLSFGAEAVLRAIMKQHKLTTCYALIEWS